MSQRGIDLRHGTMIRRPGSKGSGEKTPLPVLRLEVSSDLVENYKRSRRPTERMILCCRMILFVFAGLISTDGGPEPV